MTYENDAEHFPVRKHPRLKNYDYATHNYYFVTLCTHHKQCLFGSVGQLSAIGKLAEDFLQKIPEHFPGVVVDKYVVMPNHIHGILILSGMNLSVVIGQYKATVTKFAREIIPDLSVWQKSFHDHIIRNQADYERIWTYIEGNPDKWMEDCFYMKEDDGQSDLVGAVITAPYAHKPIIPIAGRVLAIGRILWYTAFDIP